MNAAGMVKLISRNNLNRQTRPTLVAIVDDDQALRDSISSLIRSEGFRVSVFSSAEEFLIWERMADTECLVLDVRMPGLSGLELQRRLAEMERSIPMIFATGQTDRLIRVRALQSGAAAFLYKPFTGK